MAPLRVLSARDVHDLLPPGECAQAMADVLAARARGDAHQPLRTVIRPDGAAGLMAVMPAYLPGGDPALAAGYGLKAICITPGNPAAGLDAHQGIVLLSRSATGEPVAVLNASAVTEIRTAAVSAVATRLLARPEAAVLAVLGTGVQARAHARALSADRELALIRVAGRNAGRAAACAQDLRRELGVPVVACATGREAVAGAGIVVTATSSAEPVVRGGWLAPGTHVNAVGACLPSARELDGATVAAAALFADSRASAAAESGDLLLAVADGAIGPGHIRAELGEVLTQAAPGRTDADQITVFESLGLAVEDLAAAALAWRKAEQAGRGTLAPF